MTQVAVSNLENYSNAFKLPIAYTSFYQPIGNHPFLPNDNYLNFTSAYNLSTIVFRFRSGSPMNFISIGVQQWGDADFATKNNSFPISFTSSIYQVVCSIKGSTYNKVFAPIYVSCNNLSISGFTNPTTSNEIGGTKTYVAFGK